MSRRWRVALPVAAFSATAIMFLTLSPSAAARTSPLPVSESIAGAASASVPVSPPLFRHPRTTALTSAVTADYTVQAGDTLASIAAAVYGSARDWTVLYYANRRILAGPSLILPGQRLRVPPLPARIPPPPAPPAPAAAVVPQPVPAPQPGGTVSFTGLENLWISAGGPASVAAQAAAIAECESGGNPDAYNPSGASGLWQILGQVVPGNIFSPSVNAENAVTKYRDAGDSFSPWMCQG